MGRISTRIDPIDRSIEFLLSPVLDPKERSAAFAVFASEQIQEAATQNDRIAGRHVDYTVAVDGSLGKPLSTVKPDGIVVAEWAAGLQGDIIDWIYERVVLASPMLTGRYAKSHVIWADARELVEPDPNLEASEWVITTTVPYARKLEGMSGKRPPLSADAPDGIYHVVAIDAKARFGNMANIRFAARSVKGGMLSEWASTTKMSSKGHATPRHRMDWLSRQPAIVITFR